MQNIKDEIKAQAVRKEQIRSYLDELRQTEDILTEFDENIWQATIEHVSVYPDKYLTFLFKDGTEIIIEPQKTKA
jgi:site-specific DNA recombinase